MQKSCGRIKAENPVLVLLQFELCSSDELVASQFHEHRELLSLHTRSRSCCQSWMKTSVAVWLSYIDHLVFGGTKQSLFPVCLSHFSENALLFKPGFSTSRVQQSSVIYLCDDFWLPKRFWTVGPLPVGFRVWGCIPECGSQPGKAECRGEETEMQWKGA